MAETKRTIDDRVTMTKEDLQALIEAMIEPTIKATAQQAAAETVKA